MKCFFTFAVAAALAAGLSTTASSQTSGGAGGTSGGAGGTGGSVAGGTSGSAAAGTSGTNTGGTVTSGGAGAAGTVGTTGTAGPVGSAGTAGRAGAAGTAGTVGGVGTGTAVGTQPNAAAGLNGRTNVNGRANNAAAGVNVNGNYGGNVSQTPFFSDPGVRRQLNLNANQYNALNNSYQNAYTRYNQAVSNINSNQNLTEQQRAQQLQMLESQFNQNLSGTVNSTFTNPQSLSRYNQLNRQFMGVNAFNDPAVRKQLNLTPQQIGQLRTLGNNWRQQLQQFQRNAGNDLSSANQEQWAQLQQQYGTQLNSVLTPEQQQMWSQQVGQPYSFPPSVFFNGQQTGATQLDNRNQNVVDPTQPKYSPATPGSQGSQVNPNPGTRPGTQPQPATSQPATRGAATQSGATQGGATAQGSQGGTVR